jgi:hypothetical protein
MDNIPPIVSSMAKKMTTSELKKLMRPKKTSAKAKKMMKNLTKKPLFPNYNIGK